MLDGSCSSNLNQKQKAGLFLGRDGVNFHELNNNLSFKMHQGCKFMGKGTQEIH